MPTKDVDQMGNKADYEQSDLSLHCLKNLQFRICKNKGAHQLPETAQLIGAFVFAPQISAPSRTRSTGWS